MNFCLATVVFTTFVLATLIPFVVLINENGDLDVQKLVVIALYVSRLCSFFLALKSDQPLCEYTRAALFLLFPCTMFINHVRMILTGKTTVEMMQMSSMEHRESMLLGKFYSWWEFG